MVEPRASGTGLASATAFVVGAHDRYWLVTNYHVLTGRHTETNRLLSSHGAIPDSIVIWHHSAHAREGQGVWTMRTENLFTADGSPRWAQHPRFCIKDQENTNEPNIDVVVLPLDRVDERILIYPMDLTLAETEMQVSPGLPISIIGYPFGLTGAALFPIWKTGHIASDPNAFWSPRHFLVDATTRSGMSGSPVVFRSAGWYERHPGVLEPGFPVRLMGVYSGRIRVDAEIGRVWHAALIREIIDHAVRTATEKGA